ncbi:AraC family transcriptional regulator [Luteibacter rhizovicinus]|uniref:AraC family transcriptional regulator n=1 Tax=Luteibacter rhizovicinus TaxID=242606 RepID=A0A4R3YXY0_9GAMM|nr:helix-turn-helix transcriptional regulator [Luteibacter rhizovicinus]TCV97436.1 AraC family transcriptional regulator [Luteibacter rhizovicinus]
MPTPLIPPSRLAADNPLVIAVELDEAAVRVTPAHRHERGQLIGARSGLLSIGTAQGRWVAPATHAIWIPPGEPHSVTSHGPFSGWSVYVAGQACASLPTEPTALLMSGLLREAVHRAAGWPDDTLDGPRLHIANVILDEMHSLPRGDTAGLPYPRDPRLARIAQALSDDPANPRGLDEWAAWAGISPRSLMRRFPIETGFTFTAWRQRVRLLRAIEWLADGKSITAIALDLGYENVSAFIAMFRRVFGVTPGRYPEKTRSL